MCKKVSEYDWSNILEKSKHINEQWESFAELITNAQETHILHKTIEMNNDKSNSGKIPCTKVMKIIGNKRDRKWIRYMETGNLNHYKEFSSYRTKMKKMSKANRKEYEATLASEAKTKPKTVYNYINKRKKLQKYMGNSMREYHVTKILFLMVSSWFFNILLSTSCALKKREKFIYRLPIHVVTFSQSGRYFF